MLVFVTGASGFVGTSVTKELLANGHQVLGLARSPESAQKLRNLGAQVVEGSMTDHELVKATVKKVDGVIHLAFNHDFSRWKENCVEDGDLVRAIGSVMVGTNKPLVVTSGTGVVLGMPSRTADLPFTENEPVPSDPATMHRMHSEVPTYELAKQGVRAMVVRLTPTVHGAGDKGFIPMFVKRARESGVAAYVDEGTNVWPAVHRDDAAVVFRLALEKGTAGTVYHAAAEQGVPFKDIADVIGKKLGVPVKSISREEAGPHFGFLGTFASLSNLTSSDKTKAELGWTPNEVTLLTDMERCYF
ncbi:NAD-dependent epimerase/dehydratase [Rhodotorula toruloides]|uniref:NAD-dependent epimerase/dehydratase n=1 Tax=Rhodotorula toruloides TaxID=5286 RepID=A0A511KK21_RHOTO|nr:NAD-dependent epimerase/dehydratase [Rhodotorula toruloides]